MILAPFKLVVRLGVYAMVLSFALPAHSDPSSDLTEYLRRFHENPRRAMNEAPPKADELGRWVNEPPLFLTRREFIAAKAEMRNQICRSAGDHCPLLLPERHRAYTPYSAIESRSQINSFLFQTEIVKTLLEMENQGFQQVTLPNPPWSDSFWPMNKGLIGRRWAEPGFPDSKVWADNYNYVIANPAATNVSNTLSPAEKYDLLVGDSNFTLTGANWGAGQYYLEKQGFVPSWMGICHGWSPASFMTPVPLRTVVLNSPSGSPVTFYPSDIKALASQAWGESPPRMNVLGTRCLVADPKEDAVGRVLDEACFDINPGTWHLAVVNQLGIAKRSFVFDATYDIQVWNYPVYAYKYQYFNPQTLVTSGKLAGSVIPMSEYSIDKFRTYRSLDARYVVGVSMDLTYVIPTLPSMRAVTRSAYHTVRYVYDLELDGTGQIIGGEWYSNFHPDFIWNFPAEGHTLSSGESRLAQPVTWDGRGALPVDLRAVVRESSEKRQPLAAVVEALLRLSQ